MRRAPNPERGGTLRRWSTGPRAAPKRAPAVKVALCRSTAREFEGISPGRHERRPNPSSLLIGGAPDLAHAPSSNGVLRVHAESARWPLGYESYHPAARGTGHAAMLAVYIAIMFGGVVLIVAPGCILKQFREAVWRAGGTPWPVMRARP